MSSPTSLTAARSRDRFKRPVTFRVDKLSDAVPDYVRSARRDPDGTAIRLSLARRATVNTMTAGERSSSTSCPIADRSAASLPAKSSRTVRAGAPAERALRQLAGFNAARRNRRCASAPRCSDLRAFRVRDARRHQRVVGAQRPEAGRCSSTTCSLRPRGRQGRGAADVASITQRTDVDSAAVDILLIGEVERPLFPRGKELRRRPSAFQQAEKAARNLRWRMRMRRRRACQAGFGTGQADGATAARSAGQAMPQQEPEALAPVTSEAMPSRPISKSGRPAHDEMASPRPKRQCCIGTPSAASEHAAPAAEMAPVVPVKNMQASSQPKRRQGKRKAAEPAETMHAAEAPKPRGAEPAKEQMRAARPRLKERDSEEDGSEPAAQAGPKAGHRRRKA